MIVSLEIDNKSKLKNFVGVRRWDQYYFNGGEIKKGKSNLANPVGVKFSNLKLSEKILVSSTTTPQKAKKHTLN